MLLTSLLVLSMSLLNCLAAFPRNILRSTTGRVLYHARGGGSSEESFHPILVSIEGNIGAGKTTLLKQLRDKHPEWISIDEPVDTWSNIKNENGESILQVFYKDRKRWSYTFQNCALLTRYQNIETAVNTTRMNRPSGGPVVFLTERCLQTDYYVFTQMLRDEGSISSIEIELYQRLLTELQRNSTPLSAIIHVDTAPNECIKRIRQRGRNGEDAISIDYLESLHKYQSRWIETAQIPTLSTDSLHFSQIEDFLVGLTKKK